MRSRVFVCFFPVGNVQCHEMTGQTARRPRMRQEGEWCIMNTISGRLLLFHAVKHESVEPQVFTKTFLPRYFASPPRSSSRYPVGSFHDLCRVSMVMSIAPPICYGRGATCHLLWSLTGGALRCCRYLTYRTWIDTKTKMPPQTRR